MLCVESVDPLDMPGRTVEVTGGTGDFVRAIAGRSRRHARTRVSALAVGLGVGVAIWSALGPGPPETADASPVVVTQDDVPDDAGRIIGTPDPGPDPEHSGDRGGWAQLVLLGALVAGVAFITWRIARAARHAPGSASG